jgi:NAD(P)-dependent dehydrogenase (short-subunit alcohol dehydrogenase family)
MNITDRTFIVTGGASGLGEATGRAIVAAGGSVVVADVHARGKDLADELGEEARFAHTDVTSETSVHGCVELAVRDFGCLHGVVNCAGIAVSERVLGREGPHSLDVFTRVVTVNLIGTFNVIRLAGQAISQNEPTEGGERGVIVNTASVAAFDGQIGQAAYSASKGGVAAMTLPVAREFARQGIRVVTIAPGIFDTPMLQGLPEDARKSLGEQVPFPSRLGRPDEYAALVRHVIENEMLNGEVIRLDGAIRMAPR